MRECGQAQRERRGAGSNRNAAPHLVATEAEPLHTPAAALHTEVVRAAATDTECGDRVKRQRMPCILQQHERRAHGGTSDRAMRGAAHTAVQRCDLVRRQAGSCVGARGAIGLGWRIGSRANRTATGCTVSRCAVSGCALGALVARQARQ